MVDSSAGSPFPNGVNVHADTYWSTQRDELSVVVKKRRTSAKLYMSFADAEHLRNQLTDLTGR